MHDRHQAIVASGLGLPITTHADVLTQPLEAVAGYFDGDPLALVVADRGHERDAERVADRLQRLGITHRVIRPEQLR